MISRIKSIAEEAKQKILTGVGHPTGAVVVVISQIVQVLRIASRGEEEMNVIISLLVVTRGMWLGNVTVTTGRGIVDNSSNKSLRCNGCRKVQSEKAKFLQCSKCKAVKYCSRNCQKKHWQEHKVLCNAIEYLSNKNGLETKISRTFLDFLHSGHEFFVISGHGT